MLRSFVLDFKSQSKDRSLVALDSSYKGSRYPFMTWASNS
jgi:hypothetical protein